MSCPCCRGKHSGKPEEDSKRADIACTDANGARTNSDAMDSEEHEPNPRILGLRIAISAILLAACMAAERLFQLPMPALVALYLLPYAVAGYDVVLEAVEALVKLRPFDENFLMTLATLGALLIAFVPNASPQCAEAVFVMLFFQVGELFESIAERRSRTSVEELLNIRPERARVLRGGAEESVDAEDVAVGEEIVVRPGERIPIDGVVREGFSALDVSALTGESLPVDIEPGASVRSGSVNQSGLLRITTTRLASESTAAQICDLLKDAEKRAAHSERFIRRFAKVYTPIVVAAALILAFGAPLLSGDFRASFAAWLLRGLTFLVLSCPCALVVSVPMTFFSGLGAAARRGILMKGADALEALSAVDTVVMDKTGTLTEGRFHVVAVHDAEAGSHEACRDCSLFQGLGACDEDELRLLHLAAHVEANSSHPIAEALREAYPKSGACDGRGDGCSISEVREHAGQGVVATVNGHAVAVGNQALMRSLGTEWPSCDQSGAMAYVAIDGRYAGHIIIADSLKPQAAPALRALRKMGIRRLVMLTGDRKEAAAAVAEQLELSEWQAELLPQDKVAYVEKLLNTKARGRAVAFVGDGLNDAPVLALADLGIAMGALGSDAAVSAADVVLSDDNPLRLAESLHIARRTMGIVKQNIALALGVKLLILGFAAFGLAPLGLAVFGDVGVLILCVLNALRALSARSTESFILR